MEKNLKNFYIPDEQSIYLLSANDAKKIRDWVNLCKRQLIKMGFVNVDLIGKGAFGFVFSGLNSKRQQRVFKFSRINLSQSVRERLEEEGHMLKLLNHPNIPAYIAFENIKKQGILAMERGLGHDLHQYLSQHGTMAVDDIIEIAIQLAEILQYLRQVPVVNSQGNVEHKVVVHGDIKPSNLVWDTDKRHLSLIDWGSSVFAQRDHLGQAVANNIMDLMSADVQTSNARLGDVYFIGKEQMAGELSSPRFDEQGAAATLYALASNQNNRYGIGAIPPDSLNLPKPFANTLSKILSGNELERKKAGDDFVYKVHQLKNWFLPALTTPSVSSQLPVWLKPTNTKIETVVYSSRKSFLRSQVEASELIGVHDEQLDKYYKNYLQGMGENEKAFVAAVSRFSEYPIVGGLAIHWEDGDVSVDSNLNLFDESCLISVNETINNMVDLARSLQLEKATFKTCLFDAKHTIHVERNDESRPFELLTPAAINFDVTHVPEVDSNKQHSYFEDGADPDERLILPQQIMAHIVELNKIHHTGCIIFEVLPTHLKIHNYFNLLDATKEKEFRQHLQGVLANIRHIKGIGVSGYMKLPYKDSKQFKYKACRDMKYYPVNPKQRLHV